MENGEKFLMFAGFVLLFVFGWAMAETSADCHMKVALNEVCQNITGNSNATIVDYLSQDNFVCALNNQVEEEKFIKSRIRLEG